MSRRTHSLPAALPGALLLLILLVAGTAGAQDLTVSDVRQQVEIHPDGTVEVWDERTWTLSSGDFGEVYVCLQLERGQSVEILSDSGAAGPGGPGTPFTASCEGGTEVGVRLDDRVRSARVSLHYLLHGSVDAYADVVEWYWQIFHVGEPPAVGYELTVRPPGRQEAPFDAYVHRLRNPEEPVVRMDPDDSTVTVRFERVPESNGVEFRYLMDPATFTLQGSGRAHERLLADEERVAALTALQVSPVWAVLAVLITALLLFGVIRAYLRHGREPDIPAMKYPFEPPSDLPPAAVAMLREQRFAQAHTGAAFSATVMDLARRGYGQFEGEGKKFAMSLTPGKYVPGDPLLPLERRVLDYLHSAAKPGDPHFLKFDELRKYSEKHGSTFQGRWGKEVRQWVEELFGGPLTSTVSRRASLGWGMLSLLTVMLLVGGASLTAQEVQVAILLCIPFAVGAGIFSILALPSWRPEVAAEVYGWQGFRRTLSDYTVMKDAPDDFFKLWDRYYCYAAALGVARRFLRNLERAAPARGYDGDTFARNAVWMGVHTSGLNDLGQLSRSVSSLSSALSSAGASASSGGSSFGGGGGGGAGSGGGGGVR